METEEIEILHAVGMRLGFRGAANALKGGSTPLPAAIAKSGDLKLERSRDWHRARAGLWVVNQFLNRWILSAERTLGILLNFHLMEG